MVLGDVRATPHTTLHGLKVVVDDGESEDPQSFTVVVVIKSASSCQNFSFSSVNSFSSQQSSDWFENVMNVGNIKKTSVGGRNVPSVCMVAGYVCRHLYSEEQRNVRVCRVKILDALLC